MAQGPSSSFTVGAYTANALTATTLQTPRLINGVAFDGSADIVNIAPATHAATIKSVLVNADEMPVADSAASFALKRVTIADLKTSLEAPYYTSLDQTITAAGPLTLAHGLGVQPAHVHVVLVCQTAQLGYTAGDVYILAYGNQGNNQGVSVVPDATNLNVRYGSAAATFSVIHKTTGASANITNANWKTRFEASEDL